MATATFNTGVVEGVRDNIYLFIDGVLRGTFKTKYHETASRMAVDSEKWNGTAYELIHRVIRVRKSIEFSTGRSYELAGGTDTLEALLIDISTSIDIKIQLATVAPVDDSAATKVVVDINSFDLNDSIQTKGQGVTLKFKYSIEE